MDCITVEVLRRPGESWGMKITGEKPSYIEAVQDNSPAHAAGLCSGDFILAVNGVSIYEASHTDVIALIAECKKIVRLKIYPNDSPLKDLDEFREKEAPKKGAKFWTEDANLGKQKTKKEKTPTNLKPINSTTKNENPTKPKSKTKSGTKHKKKSSSHVDYEEFCKKEESKLRKQQRNPTRNGSSNNHNEFDMTVNYLANENNDVAIEQKNFIVTREAQKKFDEQYELQGNFAGKKASVAGAFTGDENVIVQGDADDYEVRGVKSRVLAGIQHFSFTEKQEPSEEDKLKIVLYTTSLGIHRKIAYNCEQAKKILSSYRVKYEDRDIFCYPEYKEELYKRLKLIDGADFPDMPRLYIEGVYMGGLDELQEMSDCGDLRIRLQEFPKYNLRAHCTTCNGEGIIVCQFCKGKKFKKKNRFTNLKCGSCDEKGEIKCPDCI